MQLGAFSLSLSVADLAVSTAFYERLGFEIVGGNADEGWLILRCEATMIGLFCGIFEGNHILTFNPGWQQEGVAVEGSFTDVRDIHRVVADAGVDTIESAGLDGDGPAHFVIEDPDGNHIMFDQFVDRP